MHVMANCEHCNGEIGQYNEQITTVEGEAGCQECALQCTTCEKNYSFPENSFNIEKHNDAVCRPCFDKRFDL